MWGHILNSKQLKRSGNGSLKCTPASDEGYPYSVCDDPARLDAAVFDGASDQAPE
jgi:hypothetical protein